MGIELRNFSDFINVLKSHAADSVALINDVDGRTLTYSELVKSIEIVSGNLIQSGVKKADRVILFKIHDIDWVIHFLALQCLQIVAVPLDSRLDQETVESIEKTVKPKLIISNSYRSKFKTKTVEPFDRTLGSVSKVSLEEIINSFPDDDIDSEVILTSGTWSEPKGVTLTQKNIMANLTATTKAFRASSKETMLSILPLSHAYEQMCGLFMPLYFGISIVYLQELTPTSLKKALKQHEITYVIAVPRVLELLKKGIFKKIPKSAHSFFESTVILSRFLPSWLLKIIYAPIHHSLAPKLNYLIVGGAPLKIDLDHFFQGLGYKVVVGYGLSETSPVISIDNDQRSRKSNSVGKILHNIKYKFNDNGELLVSGPAVFKGYWPNKRKGKWFNTGDVGFVDEQQNLILTGRTKNLLVFPNGDKLYLEDIEHIVDRYPGIDESCVLYHTEHAGHGINLLVSSQQPETNELINYLNNKLPLITQVRKVINIYPDKLQRTHTLKLSRSKNWEKYSHLLNSQ